MNIGPRCQQTLFTLKVQLSHCRFEIGKELSTLKKSKTKKIAKISLEYSFIFLSKNIYPHIHTSKPFYTWKIKKVWILTFPGKFSKPSSFNLWESAGLSSSYWQSRTHNLSIESQNLNLQNSSQFSILISKHLSMTTIIQYVVSAGRKYGVHGDGL